MDEFRVGDRVRIVKPEGHYKTVGMEGTVVYVEGVFRVGVEHDERFGGGHYCETMGCYHSEIGRGLWYYNPYDQIELLSPRLSVNPEINLDDILK